MYKHSSDQVEITQNMRTSNGVSMTGALSNRQSEYWETSEDPPAYGSWFGMASEGSSLQDTPPYSDDLITENHVRDDLGERSSTHMGLSIPTHITAYLQRAPPAALDNPYTDNLTSIQGWLKNGPQRPLIEMQINTGYATNGNRTISGDQKTIDSPPITTRKNQHLETAYNNNPLSQSSSLNHILQTRMARISIVSDFDSDRMLRNPEMVDVETTESTPQSRLDQCSTWAYERILNFYMACENYISQKYMDFLINWNRSQSEKPEWVPWIIWVTILQFITFFVSMGLYLDETLNYPANILNIGLHLLLLVINFTLTVIFCWRAGKGPYKPYKIATMFYCDLF